MNHRLGDIKSQKSRHPDRFLFDAAIAEARKLEKHIQLDLSYLITSDIDIVKTFEILEIIEEMHG
jgi:hypothetical protein